MLLYIPKEASNSKSDSIQIRFTINSYNKIQKCKLHILLHLFDFRHIDA